MKHFLFLLGFLSFVFLSCKNDSKVYPEEAAEMSVVELPEPAAGEPEYSQNSEPVEQKIIKNAHLRFPTNDMDKTAKQIYDAVNIYKIQIQSDVEGKDYSGFNRTIILRVPNKDFEKVLKHIANGVSYFDRKEISSQDVTEQYVDIAARLKAKRELEARYLDLLKKANKVSEIIEIEKELAKIREEIESKQGQLNYLQSRVAMSSIEIYFYKPSADSGVTVSYPSKMWNALKSGFDGLSAFLLGVLHIWPFLLVVFVTFVLLRRRYLKRKTDRD